MGVGGQRYVPTALFPGNIVHEAEVWTGAENLTPPPPALPEFDFPDRPACSEALYRLSYPSRFKI
jgi:hypothetical protein